MWIKLNLTVNDHLSRYWYLCNNNNVSIDFYHHLTSAMSVKILTKINWMAACLNYPQFYFMFVFLWLQWSSSVCSFSVSFTLALTLPFVHCPNLIHQTKKIVFIENAIFSLNGLQPSIDSFATVSVISHSPAIKHCSININWNYNQYKFHNLI